MIGKIEKRAESSILESIDKLVANSFLMLLFECLMVKSHPLNKAAMKEKSVKGISDYIEKVILDLRHIIDEGGGEKEFHIRKALQMKAMLLDIYSVMKTYLSACGMIDLYIEEVARLSDAGDAKVAKGVKDNKSVKENGVSAEELKNRIKDKSTEFLEESTKYDAEEACSAILLTVLPNSFSDKELADYIAYSCKFYYENAPKGKAGCHFKQIVRSFAPQKSSDYGKFYSDEATKLFEIFEAIRAADTKNAISHKKLVSAYNKIYDKIDGIAEVITSLYAELTYITMILSSMFTFDDILKNNSVYEDFYSRATDFLAGVASGDFISEEFLSSLETMIEQEIVRLDDLAKRKELLYKNIDFQKFSENTKTLFSMEFFMTSAFLEDIDDVEEERQIDTENKQFFDFKSTQKELKSLKLLIKETCLGMNEPLKKAARRNLFLNVPLVSSYSKEKTLKYIDDLCKKTENIVELEDILLSIESIIEDDIFGRFSMYEI